MKKAGSFFNLEETLRQAVEKLAGREPEDVAVKAGVKYIPAEKQFEVPFIDNTFQVSHPEGRVTGEDGRDASVYLAIIILHYLVTAEGKPLTGQWIAYRHLPGGDIYIDPFQKRAVQPFLKTFGHRPDDFVRAAESIGGRRIQLSGISMVIPVLPKIPVCFTIWPGDDEMPASANILFDEAASSYLPTEDYAHLPAVVNGAMKGKLET